MWLERVKNRIGESNPTFLATEGGSTSPRILGHHASTVGQNEGPGGNRILYVSRDSDLVVKLFPKYNRSKLGT